ncbi:MAG: methionyl-tRNA formyltransferase [Prevotella sp.]
MTKEDLRIIFMGTPEFAVGTLQALVEGGFNVVAVVTQPDKPVGRHQDTLQPSPVKQYAVAHSIPVLQPVKMKDEAFIDNLRGYKADIQVVVAFRMLPEIVWAMPRLGTFNVHASLLPQYRGAAPINWAVINGETVTGVTTFFLDHDIDTGRIIEQRPFPIPHDADVEYVYNGLMDLGAATAVSTLEKIIEGNGTVESISQNDLLATSPAAGSSMPLRHAPKIFKDTCRLCWDRPSLSIYNFVRGLSPYPGVWTVMEAEGEPSLTVKIFKTAQTHMSLSLPQDMAVAPGTVVVEDNHLYISTADTLLEILELQVSGKRRMPSRDFLNGFRKIASYHCV